MTITFHDAPSRVFDWRGPLGGLLATLDLASVSDIDVEPFKLEEYVLNVYAEGV